MKALNLQMQSGFSPKVTSEGKSLTRICAAANFQEDYDHGYHSQLFAQRPRAVGVW